MRCDEVDSLVEAIASGDLSPDGVTASHLASCPSCTARVDRARAIDRVLEARAVPEPPARFTADAMARIRRERWRAEQMLDVGFNVAVLAGVLLVVAGLMGLVWISGLAPVGFDLFAVAAAAGSVIADRLAREFRMVMLALVFMTTALGVWWWAEGDTAQ